jgi:hypothetical protein
MEGSSVWLQLARAEIELRTQLEVDARHDLAEHVLEFEARLKREYPDMPFRESHSFREHLRAGGHTEAAWDLAVVWLQSTDWFKLRRS